MPFVAGPFAICCIAFSIMLGLRGDLENQMGASYFAVTFACMGIYPSAPSLIAWVGNNMAPSSRRAVGLAFNIGIGNAGGVMGSYLFFDREAPVYATGFGLSLAFALTGLLAAVVVEFSYKWTNRQRAKIPEADTRARYTQDQLVALGNRSPLFKFTL